MQKTTEQEIAELQNRLKELEQKKAEELTFPIYVKHPSIGFFSRIDSPHKTVDVTTYGPAISHNNFTSTLTKTQAWNEFVSGRWNEITPEEFEAARAETLKKLSEI